MQFKTRTKIPKGVVNDTKGENKDDYFGCYDQLRGLY